MEYPNTGALFRTKEKKSPTSPDMWGDIKIDKHYLLSLIEDSNSQLITVRLSGWSSVSPNTGTKYLSLKVDTRPPLETVKKTEVVDDDLPF
jgi:hypothetical protein